MFPDVPKSLDRDVWLSRLGTRTGLKVLPPAHSASQKMSTFLGRLSALELKQAMNGPDATPAKRETPWHAQVGDLLDAGLHVQPDFWQFGYLHVSVYAEGQWDPPVVDRCLACFNPELATPMGGG